MSRKRIFVYKLFINSFILLLFSLYLRFSETIRLMKEFSKQTTTEVSVVLNRSIFFFYEKSLRYVPVFLMLCHWYGVYSFHDNPREILIDIRENEECIAYLYFMVYVFPLSSCSLQATSSSYVGYGAYLLFTSSAPMPYGSITAHGS